MSALTAVRDTPEFAPRTTIATYPVAASVKIYAGALVALNAGYLQPAATATGLQVVGQSLITVDNTAGGAGAANCLVQEGTFRWDNDSTIAQAQVGTKAYANDDHTVSHTATGKSVAGIIALVDSNGVWVTSSLVIGAEG